MAMLLFLTAVLLSWLCSDYRGEAFWGTSGRFMGAALFFLCGISFFALSHTLQFKRWYLDAFLVTGVVVCVLGIMQYFRLDPLGFKEELYESDYGTFMSTIGNINTYTSYVALLFAVGSTLWVDETSRWKQLWYALTVLLSFFALVTGNSDNAYLSIGVLLCLLPFHALRTPRGLRHYMLMLSLVSTEWLLIGWLNERYADHVLAVDGLFRLSLSTPVVPFLAGMVCLGTALLYLGKKQMEDRYGRVHAADIGRKLWALFLIVVIGSILYVIWDAGQAGNEAKYGAAKNYLVFCDEWGTHRGYIWRIGMDCYTRLSPLHQLFGSGPDTYGIVMQRFYYKEMVEKYQEIFDSAHNEYLQYLLTLGIVGVVSYVSLLGTALWEMLKKSKEEVSVMGIVYAVICYATQALVNIAVPIVFPIVFSLLILGVSGESRRETEREGEARVSTRKKN